MSLRFVHASRGHREQASMDGSAFGRRLWDAKLPFHAIVNRPWTVGRKLQSSRHHEPSTMWQSPNAARPTRPPMSKRGQGFLDVACPAAKRVVVDGVGGGCSRTAENRTVAQDLLRGVLAGLLVHKTAADFPLQCLATVLREVAPLLQAEDGARLVSAGLRLDAVTPQPWRRSLSRSSSRPAQASSSRSSTRSNPASPP